MEFPKAIVRRKVDEYHDRSETEDVLEDVNVTFINSKWREFQEERNEGYKTAGSILTEPPVKPCPVQLSFKPLAPNVNERKLQAFKQHAKQMPVTGGSIVLFKDTYSWLKWFLELTKNGFQTMQYLAVFVCQKEIDRDPSVFTRNSVYIAIVTKRAGTHRNGLCPSFSHCCSCSSNSNRNEFYGSVPSADNRLLNKE